MTEPRGAIPLLTTARQADSGVASLGIPQLQWKSGMNKRFAGAGPERNGKQPQGTMSRRPPECMAHHLFIVP